MKSVVKTLAPTTSPLVVLARADASVAQILRAPAGEYLGYFVGPGKAELSWAKPTAKLVQRRPDWEWAAWGINAAILTYNTCV